MKLVNMTPKWREELFYALSHTQIINVLFSTLFLKLGIEPATLATQKKKSLKYINLFLFIKIYNIIYRPNPS